MYRLQYAERKVYIFLMHIRSRVCFLFAWNIFLASVQLYAPVGVLFVFRGKPSNMSQTENSAKPKGDFFMMTVIRTLLKNERGDAHEEISLFSA